jgi:hypothetical protein
VNSETSGQLSEELIKVLKMRDFKILFSILLWTAMCAHPCHAINSNVDLNSNGDVDTNTDFRLETEDSNLPLKTEDSNFPPEREAGHSEPVDPTTAATPAPKMTTVPMLSSKLLSTAEPVLRVSHVFTV